MGGPRGTSNSNHRGSSLTRLNRRTWLLNKFGDGEKCPCFKCGDTLIEGTLTVDRIVPGIAGGHYLRGNIRPACKRCNMACGAKLYLMKAKYHKRDKTVEWKLARLMWQYHLATYLRIEPLKDEVLIARVAMNFDRAWQRYLTACNP